jgi:hypothetical protein
MDRVDEIKGCNELDTITNFEYFTSCFSKKNGTLKRKKEREKGKIALVYGKPLCLPQESSD